MTQEQFEALGIEVPYTVHMFLVSAYIDTVAHGEANLQAIIIQENIWKVDRK